MATRIQVPKFSGVIYRGKDESVLNYGKEIGDILNEVLALAKTAKSGETVVDGVDFDH